MVNFGRRFPPEPGQNCTPVHSRYGIARLATIVRALANVDSHGALEMRRPLPRWGSGLGPLMKEHIALMRTMGYRYDSQEVRFSAFDRFLQTRPDLTGQPLRAQLDAWTGESPTLTRAWDGSQPGAELSRAVRLRDSTAESLPSDPRLQRAIRRTYRAPYIYSPAEVARIFQIARDWPAPRWPLLPATMHTMFMLAYCAGLRLGEILRLNVSDVLVADAAIEIRNTKFFKSRRLPIAKSTFSALQDYLKERRRAGGPDDPDSPLLWHQKGAGRYSMTRAENPFRRVASGRIEAGPRSQRTPHPRFSSFLCRQPHARLVSRRHRSRAAIALPGDLLGTQEPALDPHLSDRHSGAAPTGVGTLPIE